MNVCELKAVADDSSLMSCYAAWHPSGAYFAIPTRINGECGYWLRERQLIPTEAGIINREGWTKGHTYASDAPKAVSLALEETA